MARKSRKPGQTASVPAKAAGSQIFAAAIYARLSVENSGKDDDGAALETQISVCREYVRSCPWLQLVEVYSDNGKTGTVFDRPAFNRLMEDIRSGKINCIVVRDLSRFGRDYVEAGTYLERIFPQLGVRFISVKENFDSFATDGSNESLMIPLQNLINSLYARDISRKVSSALRTQMENGEFRRRKVPYGYQWDAARSNIIPDERTAGFVRNIFQWKLDGISVSKMLDRLEQAKAPIPETLQRVNGLEGVNTVCWSTSTIHGMLKNPVYCGDTVVGRSRRALYAGIRETQIRNPDEWYVTRDTHEGLVSRETFDTVQRLMNAASETRTRKMEQSQEARVKLQNLFDGKIFCADCGQRMYFHRKKIDRDKRGRWYAFYECSTNASRRAVSCTPHYIRQDTLEEKVLSALKLHIQVALDYEELLKKLQSSAIEKDMRAQLTNAVRSVTVKLRAVSEKRTRLYDDYAEGILDEEEYTFAKSSYDGQWEQLNQQLDDLTRRRDGYLEAVSPDNRWIRLMKEVQYTDTLNQALVDSVIDKVLIHDGGCLEIVFRYHDVYELTRQYVQILSERRASA